MANASQAQLSAYLAVLLLSGSHILGIGPALRRLQPYQPPLQPYSRWHRPLLLPRATLSRRSSIDALSSSPTTPTAILPARRSVVVIVGGACLLLGRQDALLTVDTRL